jgi:hypothetical protein
MTARESVALPENPRPCSQWAGALPGFAVLRQSLRPTLEQKHTVEDELVAIFWTVPDGIADRLTIAESRRYSRRIALSSRWKPEEICS